MKKSRRLRRRDFLCISIITLSNYHIIELSHYRIITLSNYHIISLFIATFSTCINKVVDLPAIFEPY
jgi:hypothetical protein